MPKALKPLLLSQHHCIQMKAFFGITEMIALIALSFFLTSQVQEDEIVTAV